MTRNTRLILALTIATGVPMTVVHENRETIKSVPEKLAKPCQYNRAL